MLLLVSHVLSLSTPPNQVQSYLAPELLPVSANGQNSRPGLADEAFESDTALSNGTVTTAEEKEAELSLGKSVTETAGAWLPTLFLRARHSSTPSPECVSTCTAYRNRVVIPPIDGTAKAGLGDRAAVINELGNLAATLCAKVVMGGPSVLDPVHNNGIRLSPDVWWSRYFTTVGLFGENYLLPLAAQPSMQAAVSRVSAGGDANSTIEGYTVLKVPPAGWDSSTPMASTDSFETARALAAQPAQRFMWLAPMAFNELVAGAKWRSLVPSQAHCHFTSVAPSALTQQVATAALQLMAAGRSFSRLPPFATLHVRRGDVAIRDDASGCDTSVPGVVPAISMVE
jgi:hypothetical protein